MNQYECYLCKNQDDCIEVKSQAVRDVSIRCGLTCHSDFQSERDKVLPSGAVFDNTKRMVDEIRENERQQLIDKIFSGRKKIMKKKGIGFGEFLATETKLLASLRQKAGEP